MMTTANFSGTKVTTTHQAKLAYIYVRQSSLGQVTRHAESTTMQYQLVERAVQLGWPRDRIKIIDEDLGKSGSSMEERFGFQRLMTEIGLGQVGLVLSLDASRLARNNSDWYRLLELCSLFDTLIADTESLYHPRIYADRMMLGLSGMMSEAELHQLKLRLQAGARQKAERGELRLALPVGLVRLTHDEVSFHPDEEVQSRIRLVFEKFNELGTAKAVVRYLQRTGLLLPSRPLRGPAPHEVRWQPARNSAILGILKNPAYAGAYVYGRTTLEPTRRQPGRPHTGTVSLPIDKWPVLLHNVYPAYISWEQFLANQEQLRTNQSNYQEDKHGVPRKGQALLQGIIVCGRCGARMRLHYSGHQGDYPVYVCAYAQSEYNAPRCQEVRALDLDAQVEHLLLAALAPDQIEMALATLDQLEREQTTLHKHWQLRQERAAYEAERARRQYDSVEPENRLVARTLEKQWEEKLRAQEQIEQEYRRWVEQHPLDVTPVQQQEILALGEDLPKLWHASTTTAADRKQILRAVIQEVIVDQHQARGQVWFQVNWQTGAVSEHWYKRRVSSYDNHADLELIEERVRQLHAQQKMDKEIAEVLNTEGFRTTLGQLFNGNAIWLLRKRWNLPSVNPTGSNPTQWDDGAYSVEGLAALLDVFPGTVYQWLRKGRISGRQLGKGTPWKLYLSQDDIDTLRQQIRRVNHSKKEVS